MGYVGFREGKWNPDLMMMLIEPFMYLLMALAEKAGIDLYFMVPLENIELIPEKGYSYIRVAIGGSKFILNVSGGTSGDGWTDFCSTPFASTTCNLPLKTLKAKSCGLETKDTN